MPCYVLLKFEAQVPDKCRAFWVACNFCKAALFIPIHHCAVVDAGFLEMQRSCRAQYAARRVLQGKLQVAVARAIQAEKDRAAAAAASVTHLHDLEKLRRDVRPHTHNTSSRRRTHVSALISPGCIHSLRQCSAVGWHWPHELSSGSS